MPMSILPIRQVSLKEQHLVIQKISKYLNAAARGACQGVDKIW